MKTKTFDCVEMMHEAGLRIYEETKGMTLEEELAYWRERRKEAIDMTSDGREEDGRPCEGEASGRVRRRKRGQV